VGKVSKAKKRKKKKPGVGRGENKVPKKKQRSGEKRNWEGGGEKIKLQKKTEIRADKGYSDVASCNLDWATEVKSWASS
jgi:hypothetical protein